MTSIDMKHGKSIERFADSAAFGEPRELLRAFFNATTLGLAILDNQFRFRAVNNALGSMNGVPPAAHLGETIRGFLEKRLSRWSLHSNTSSPAVVKCRILRFVLSCRTGLRSVTGSRIISQYEMPQAECNKLRQSSWKSPNKNGYRNRFVVSQTS